MFLGSFCAMTDLREVGLVVIFKVILLEKP